MTVVVSFIRASGAGVIGVGSVRIQERITIPGTTTATALEGEYVIVGNGESSMVAVAFSTAPDAAALASTSSTNAGMPVGAGAVSHPISMRAGDKVNIKVVS